MFNNRHSHALEAAPTPANPAGLPAALAASPAGDVALAKFTPPPDSSCPKPDLAEPSAHLPLEVTP